MLFDLIGKRKLEISVCWSRLTHSITEGLWSLKTRTGNYRPENIGVRPETNNDLSLNSHQHMKTPGFRWVLLDHPSKILDSCFLVESREIRAREKNEGNWMRQHPRIGSYFPMSSLLQITPGRWKKHFPLKTGKGSKKEKSNMPNFWEICKAQKTLYAYHLAVKQTCPQINIEWAVF